MANCCPRACSRLAAAASFLAIGVVQIIAGMILLRSKYVYLLSGPNFWTASANIAVGALLGISATVWKTIDKKTKHTARRNLLAAMACSAIILNGTTAAILIMGESNSLLVIHLESSNSYGPTTLAKEMLAYAYATSVCSPVICIVVSIAFLTGMCFSTKIAKKRSFDFKNILRGDSTQDFSWVYTPQLTKSDPEVMKTTLSSSSSESELSSDDSDSYNYSILPVHSRSHTPMNKAGNIHLETSSNRSKFQNHIRKKDRLEATVHSSCSKKGRVSFQDESSSEKNRTVFASAEFLNPSRKSSLDRKHMSALLTCEKAKNSLPNRQMRSRVTPKVLFTEYPSGNTVHRSAILPHVRGEKFLNHTDLPVPQLKMANSVDFAASVNANGKTHDLYIVHTSVDSPSVYEDAVLQSRDIEVDSVEEFHLRNHEKLQRTSTAEHSKVQKEVELLDDSAIHPDYAFDLRESYPNGNTQQTMNNVKNSTLQSSVLQNSSDLGNTSCLEGEVIADRLKNSNFRSKLPSKLIPVPTPVISDGHRYLIDRISPRKCKRKLYSKSNKIYHNYNDCNQAGLSSFKGGRQADEVDAVCTRKHNSSVNKSLMESISEFPADETNETFLPSTSTHTSGYVSTLEDESGDESDVDFALKQKNREPSPSVHQEQTGEKTIPSSEKKSEDISKTNKYRQSVLSRSLRRSFQNVVEEFMKENPDIKSEEISHMLRSSVV